VSRKYSSTYRFGRITIATSIEAVFLLVRGSGKVHLYKLPKFSRLISRSLIVATLFVLLFSVSAVVLNQFRGRTGEIASDEERKSRLMLSRNTDYAEPEERPGLKIVYHTVKRGQTLGQIAREYGISMDSICGSNKLVSYDMVGEGTRLRIPNREGILYTVKKGQSIYSISRMYRVPVEKVLADNTFYRSDFVAEGDVVFVPDAKPLDLFPGFLWPTRRRAVTSGYGWRKNPFNRAEIDFHRGLDIRTSNDWVRSTKYGRVTFAGWLGGYGKTVVVAHPGGWKSLYGHLSRILVRQGQYVKQGQQIGKSGNTGYSSGAHLHFELIKNHGYVNPHKYVR
jgi:murein DD-endopeptidase MepM/ murein hydrolase activator NlpD